MKNIFKNLLFIFILSPLFSVAQEDNLSDTLEVDFKQPSIAVATKIEKNKVILRWAPTDYSWFLLGNEHGYVVEKMTLSKNPETESDQIPESEFVFKKLPNMPMLPWSVEKFREEIKSEQDVYLGVTMEILHGGVIMDKNPEKGENLKDAMYEQGNRFAFALTAADLNKEAAQSLALRYDDTDVSQGKYYVYRVYINYSDKEFKSDTVELFIQFDGTTITPQYKVGNAHIEAHDKALKIVWNYSNNSRFSAYDIERSEDQVNWIKLNTRPYFSSIPEGSERYSHIFIDDSLTNNKKYFYRICGYTPFGEKGLYSDVLSETPIDLTPPAPAFKVKAEDQGGVVLITWDAMPNEPDFDGFYVGRSNSATGPFDKISDKLKKEDRGFLDFQPDPLNNNYYVVISADKNGNEALSYVALGYIVDSMPPMAPTGLKGTIDTTGMVRLEWNRGPEADIIGYRVYWANDTLSEFSQLTGEVHSHTVYLDSVNVKTLNKYTYYKIAAVDHRFNHSEYSEILEIKKPDLVPPAAPVINFYNIKDNKVEMKWINSSSDDVVTQQVEKSTDNEKWMVIKKVSNNTLNNHSDSGLAVNNEYYYRIIAIDDAGNKTSSSVLNISNNSKGLDASNIDLRVTINEGVAELKWTTTLKPLKFVVYKTNGDNTQVLVSLSDSEKSFNDRTYKANDVYYIKAILTDGSETKTFQQR